MRKYAIVLLILAIIIVVPAKVSADEITDVNSPISGTSCEDITLNEEQSNLKDANTAKNNQIFPRSNVRERKQLSVPNYKQEKDWWCGPASAQMVIRAVDGRYIEQSVLARDMGSSQGFTNIYDLKNDLNQYRGISNYYVVGDVAYRNLLADIRQTINENHPLIAHIFTRNLNPLYSFNNGHYVVITGYDYTWFGNPIYTGYSEISPFISYDKLITYNDPWRDSRIFGTRTVHYSTFLESVKTRNGDGWYLR